MTLTEAGGTAAMSARARNRHAYQDAVYSDHGPQGGPARAIALALASFMDKAMETYAGIDAIARRSGYCRHTVIVTLRALEAGGWITQGSQGSRGRAVTRVATIPTGADVDRSTGADVDRCTGADGGANQCIPSAQPVHSVPATGADLHPISSEKPSQKLLPETNPPLCAHSVGSSPPRAGAGAGAGARATGPGTLPPEGVIVRYSLHRLTPQEVLGMMASLGLWMENPQKVDGHLIGRAHQIPGHPMNQQLSKATWMASGGKFCR